LKSKASEPPFPSDPKDPVEVLEQFTFLYQQFDVALLILETSEDLLLLLDFDLVEDEDQEDSGGS
jgi:hypothetical protein